MRWNGYRVRTRDLWHTRTAAPAWHDGARVDSVWVYDHDPARALVALEALEGDPLSIRRPCRYVVVPALWGVGDLADVASVGVHREERALGLIRDRSSGERRSDHFLVEPPLSLSFSSSSSGPPANTGRAKATITRATTIAAANTKSMRLISASSFHEDGTPQPRLVDQRNYGSKHKVLHASPKWTIFVWQVAMSGDELRTRCVLRSSQSYYSTHSGE